MSEASDPAQTSSAACIGAGRIVLAQLPSPPGKNVFREWAGGMGTALPSTRTGWGHDQNFYDIPLLALLYVARGLQQAGADLAYHDFQDRQHLELAEFDAAFAGASVLITQLNLPSLEHDIQLIARARAAAPGLRVLLLGPSAKWFAPRLLGEGVADAVMQESEELLTPANALALRDGRDEALEGCAVWRQGAVVMLPARTRMASLDFVDFPAYDLLDFSRYESDYYLDRRYRYATVFTTKGCPYSCGYCPYPYGFGKRLVYRAPERVADDIARLHSEFGVEQILFRDQVFTVNPKHARAVCEAIIARDLGVVWVCETRYDVLDRELLELMWRAGCREIHFGLESADAEMFATVAKSDGKPSLERFAEVIAMTKARGMRAHVHLIVGLPDESRRSLRNTALWLRKVRPDSVQLAYFVPYPGTPLFEELRASGELGDLDRIDWESFGSFTDPVIPTRHLSIDQVRRGRARLAVDWQFTLADRVANRLRRLAGLQAA